LVAIPIVMALVVDVVYVALITNQNSHHQVSPHAYIVPFIAGYVAAMAVLLAVSLLPRLTASIRIAMRTAAAAGLLVLGVLALFSIGLPLVIAGAIATAAVIRTHPVRLSSVSAIAGAVIALAVLFAGFEITERVIACPDQGTMGGSGSGFLSGPYHYECVNGKLTFQSG
jgi:hypothetical protein